MVNTAALNIGVHVSFWITVFLGYMPSKGFPEHMVLLFLAVLFVQHYWSFKNSFEFVLKWTAINLHCYFLLSHRVNQVYVYIYTLPCAFFPLPPLLLIPLGHHKAVSWSAVQQPPTRVTVCDNAALLNWACLSLSTCPCDVLHLSTSIHDLYVSSSVSFFRFHTCVNIGYLISELLHSLWQTLGPSTSNSRLPSFLPLGLSNTPLYNLPHLPNHLSVDGHFGGFHVLAVVNSAAVNVVVSACLSGLRFSLGVYTLVGLLGHMTILFLGVFFFSHE